MPPALDTITANATAAAAAGSAMAAVLGDSLVVRAVPSGKRVLLLNAWADVQTAGFFQITSPRLHDNTRGLRFFTVISEPKPMLAFPTKQELYEGDVLGLTIAENAVAGDIAVASLLVYYEDLQGVAARLIDKATLMKRGVEMVTVQNTIATVAGGGYTGAQALNTASDLLKADNDYALVGYRVQVECGTVCWRGADTGNLRVSGPGDELGADCTTSWFLWLAEYFDLPLIPVFNSSNRASIFVDCAQDENALAVPVTSIFVRLA
jgi:hypothetical protein